MVYSTVKFLKFNLRITLKKVYKHKNITTII